MTLAPLKRYGLTLLLLAAPLACGDGEPPAGECGDGILDTGETCDPAIESGPGACPIAESCGEDACTTWAVSGSAEACTAECVSEATITACVDDDGCCPAACDETNDVDCMAQTGDACPCEVINDPGGEVFHLCDACRTGDCYRTADEQDHYCIDMCNWETGDCSHLEGEWHCEGAYCVR